MPSPKLKSPKITITEDDLKGLMIAVEKTGDANRNLRAAVQRLINSKPKKD